MKSKALIPLIVGLAVGLIAVKYTIQMSSAKGSGPAADATLVVMAMRDIPSTAAITADMLMVTKTPKTPLLPDNAFEKAEDVLGRVALKSIPQGVPILPSMMAPEGTLPGLIVRVKEGYRAVAVKIDESTGVGYLVKPNDWVDVLAVMETTRLGKREMESQLILERVQVGAVGQLLNDSAEDGSGTSKHAKSVTLLVKVDDVPKLHLAQTRGKITLAMRGAEDTEMTSKTTGQSSAWSGLLATMWRSGQPRQQSVQLSMASPQAEPQPYTVAVVNASADSDLGKATQHVTYYDDTSMDVIGIERGSTPSRRYPRPNASTGRQTATHRGSYGQNENNMGNPKPSEESE